MGQNHPLYTLIQIQHKCLINDKNLFKNKKAPICEGNKKNQISEKKIVTVHSI